MTSKTIRIDHVTQANCADLTVQPVSAITALYRKISTLFVRSELAKAQAGYRTKQQRQTTHRIPQDMINSLAVEDKLRLGMYRWID
jgi:hypothetical protein